jgi:hypothetical protein
MDQGMTTIRASKAPRTAVREYRFDAYTAIQYLSLNETLELAKMILESGRN